MQGNKEEGRKESRNVEKLSSISSRATSGPLESAAKDGIDSVDSVSLHRLEDLIHDIRTPLVAVRGYAKLMLQEQSGPLNNTQREYLTVMLENSNRVIQLLNDLAHLAKDKSV